MERMGTRFPTRSRLFAVFVSVPAIMHGQGNLTFAFGSVSWSILVEVSLGWDHLLGLNHDQPSPSTFPKVCSRRLPWLFLDAVVRQALVLPRRV